MVPRSTPHKQQVGQLRHGGCSSHVCALVEEGAGTLTGGKATQRCTLAPGICRRLHRLGTCTCMGALPLPSSSSSNAGVWRLHALTLARHMFSPDLTLARRVPCMQQVLHILKRPQSPRQRSRTRHAGATGVLLAPAPHSQACFERERRAGGTLRCRPHAELCTWN